jgi:hypothetical protein
VAAAARKTEPKRVAAVTPVSRKATAILLEDILYLKELVRRVEPVAVRTPIDAFAP